MSDYIDRPLGESMADICPRCGGQMAHDKVRNALSRHLDAMVCPACGLDEAVRDYFRNPLPLSEWHIVSITKGES